MSEPFECGGVLKAYLGFVLVSCSNNADREVIKKEEVYVYGSLEVGGTTCHMGKFQGWSGGRGERAEHCPEPLLGCLVEGKGEAV